MNNKTQLTAADIMDTAEYAAKRKDIRKAMIEMKKNRRQAVGPAIMLYFENFETMLYQVHEMVLAEKGGAEQVEDELTSYAPLVPNGNELVATMMLEYTDADIRARELAKLGGIEEYVTLTIEADNNIEKIQATWEQDVDRTSPEGKTSSIHFLHFPFTDEQIKKYNQSEAKIILALNHPNYGHMAVLSEVIKNTLGADFKQIN
jgi:hypothetical protein